MLITIYDRNGNVKAELSPDDSSTQVKEIQGDNVLTLSFTHYMPIILDVDDYIDFEKERYWLTEAYRPVQKSSCEWCYDIKLYGIECLLRNFLVLKQVDNEEEPVFTLTAPPCEHVAMIVRCMNSGMGNISDWKVGQVDGTENIVIDYFGKYCDEALHEIADKVGAEAWVDGQTVNICRCEQGDYISLGYNNGLTDIEPDKADNVKFYTRLYPIGSSRNIDVEKYGFSRLQLPDGRKYVEINANKYGRVDHYEDTAFAEIYPRRIGEISSVRSEVKTGENGNPFKIYYFHDNNLPFDPNDYEIGGLVKRVSFQEGSELAGLGNEDNGTYFFEVNFNSNTKEFEIITIWPYDDDTQLPGGSFVPKVGDKYILWNLRMPDEYYSLAEDEFLAAVNKYNSDQAHDISVFKCTTDHVWVEDNHVDLFVGRRVRLESKQYFPETGYRDSRITKITRKVTLPSYMDIEISDVLSKTSKQHMSESITDVRNYAKSIGASISLPDIIRTGDRTRPTDNNLFSARRTQQDFLSKRTSDRSAGSIASDIAFEVGNFASGVSGAIMRQRADGQTELEVDRLWIRVKALFEELVAVRTASLAGEQLVTPAGSIKCTSVESVENGWRCYFLAEQDGEKIDNLFKAGDLARCNYFNASTASGNKIHNKFYWRLVTAVGDNYIELSKTECASASDAPEAGDVICQLGNKNASDSERQNAIRISTVLGDVPSIILFSRINDFALEEKDAVAIGVDATTGRPYIRAYGDVHFGNRNSSGDSIFDYDSANGEMNYRGNLHISSHINGTNKTLGEIADRVVGGGNALLNARFDREDGEGGLLYWQKSGFAKLDRENTLDGVASVQIDVQGTEIEGWRGITQGGVIQNNPSLNVNGRKWVTVSVWAMTDDPTAFDKGAQLEVNFSNEEGTRLPGSMAINIVPKHAGVWERFEITAPTEVATNPYAATFFAYVVQNGRLWLAKPQLEWGNVATEWVPNPLDRSYLEEAIEEASADSTDIKGGLVLTTALMTGQTDSNGERRIMAGINGVASDPKALALWAGGKMIDAAEEPDNPDRARFGMRHNGTGYAADNTIRFEEHEVQVGDDVVLDKDGLTLFDSNSGSEERNARLSIANIPIPQELETAANVNTQSIKTPATASLQLVHVPGFTNPNTGMSTPGYYALMGTVADGSAYSKTYDIADKLTAGATISGTIKLSFDAKLSTNSNGVISQPLNATARVRVMRAPLIAGVGVEPVVVKEVTARFLTTTVGTTHRHTATLTLSANIVIPGTHSIVVDIPLPSVLGAASSQSVSMTLTPKVTVAMGVVKQTLLGNNGFASIWPQSAQLQQEGMWGVLVGKFGFRIREDVGFEITTDGGNNWDRTIQIVKKS